MKDALLTYLDAARTAARRSSEPSKQDWTRGYIDALDDVAEHVQGMDR